MSYRLEYRSSCTLPAVKMFAKLALLGLVFLTYLQSADSAGAVRIEHLNRLKFFIIKN